MSQETNSSQFSFSLSLSLVSVFVYILAKQHIFPTTFTKVHKKKKKSSRNRHESGRNDPLSYGGVRHRADLSNLFQSGLCSETTGRWLTSSGHAPSCRARHRPLIARGASPSCQSFWNWGDGLRLGVCAVLRCQYRAVYIVCGHESVSPLDKQ